MDLIKIIETLDALALALAEHGHVWTDRERELYDKAIAALDAEPIGD